MDLVKEAEKQRRHVVVEVFSPTWNELLNQFKENDVEIDPIYQRAFRWSLFQQTQFIESLLLNIPTPPIFLAEKANGKFEVIDGLQRFSTMIRFFSEEVYESQDIKPADSKNGDNDLCVPTTLISAPILTGLDGVTRQTMPETLLRTIRYARVQVILLKKESSPVAKYNVFTRLNRAGSTLSDQEIRNCSVRLFDTKFADDLRELAALPSIRSAMSLSKALLEKMGIEENILRLLAFAYSPVHTKEINVFLDKFMYKAASGEFNFTAGIKKHVQLTFDLISEVYPHGEAFKFHKGGKFSGAFSTNLYDIVGCGIYKNLSKVKLKTRLEIRKKIIALHNESEVIELTGAGSNTRKKMVGRVEFGQKWFV